MMQLTFNTKHLLIMVIAFICGICWTPFPTWSLTALGAIFYIGHQEKGQQLLILSIFCLFFFGTTRYHQNRELFFSNSNLLEKICNATGVVQEILPRLDEQEDICIVIKLSKLEIGEKEYFINKKVYLFVPFYTKVWIKPHQKIVLKNIIFKHPISTSYQEYLIREKIWATAHQKWLSYSTIEKPSLFMQQMDELYNISFQKAGLTLSQLTHTLYLSIFCGKKFKSQTTTEIKRLFQYWGISHHLARSGLHLIILIGLLLFLLSFIPCSSSKKQWFVMTLLSFYYITTYPSVAFMRAFYMYIFYTLCKQLHIPSNPLHILLITTLFILTLNPHHLFFLDFQLSFSITALILWFFQTAQNRKTIAS
ncbi:ComEC/Rec2 family competence protein [Candidatus Babeliales bacterium]|nr:ComEC/Rec2 family competence protein [Candidatus Babeliales bacterium]MBP9843476.1 ComEC/Rec2 family competence protein [Candidatus Babeliales bacterium]